MPDIVPAWMWRDPGEIIEQLLQRSAREAAKARGQGLTLGAARPVARDRYYTIARRVAVRSAMKRVMRG